MNRAAMTSQPPALPSPPAAQPDGAALATQ